jgi:hypothetical protein
LRDYIPEKSKLQPYVVPVGTTYSIPKGTVNAADIFLIADMWSQPGPNLFENKKGQHQPPQQSGSEKSFFSGNPRYIY